MSSKFLNANTDVNLSANSDSQIPSQKAVKTYVDNKTSVLATKEEVTTITNQIGDQVSVIESKIPSEASDTNQLADKQFVQDLTSALNFVTWVDTLPETGESKYIYAVPREETDTDGKPIAALYLWDGTRWNGAGAFSLNVDPATLATKTDLTNYLPLTGGTLSGKIVINTATDGKVTLQHNNNTIGLITAAGTSSNPTLSLTNNTGSTIGISHGSGIFLKRENMNRGSEILCAADKSVANGVASLDGNKKIPIDQIPNLDNKYVSVILGTADTPIAAGTHNTLKRYGWFYNNGALTGIGLLTLAQNMFYQIDKRGGTVTCNYDDVVSNLSSSLVNGSYSGYFTNINPSTAFADKPFVFEVTKPTSFEQSDVMRLRIYGHRLGNAIKSSHYKIEVKYNTGNTDWATAYEYEGAEKNISGQYSLQVAGVASTSYHPIYGIRLTVYESTSTVFDLSEVELLASRGTEKLPDAMHVLADTGGTVYGNITIPDSFGSFKGNLTGTASKATADASGNTITTTYATKNELNTGLSSKQGTLTAGTGISITDSTISNAFTSLDSYTTFSEAALNENSSFIYKNTNGAYLRGNFINFVDSIIKPSFATKSDLSTKQNTISDLDTIRSGAALGSTALQSVPEEYITESELAAKNYATTTDVTTGLSTKQDTISDLSTIREGAALGATSVQHEDLSEVAISGMYSDLTGKPGAATTDTLGLVKVDGTTITATADGVISAKGGSGTKRSIGEVYFSQSSLASDNPGALPLFTGETIASANTIYPDFYNWVSNHPSLCCTLDSYNASIKTFGECPKYVVGNDEIELPVAWDPSKANLSEAFDYYTDFALLELDGKTYVSVNVDSVMYYTANKNISTDSVMQLYTDVELTKKAYIRYKVSKNVYTKPIGLQIVTIKGITKAYIRTGTSGNYGDLYGTSGVLGFNTTDYTSLSVETGAIKLPLIKNYIKAANTADGIKNIEAGLPNITGQTGVNTTGGNGVFSNTIENIKGTVAISGYNTTTTTSNFDASRSSAVYGKSNTVTPASTTLYPWVVAYTAAIPASTAQAAEFQNALGGKVDLPTGKTQSDVDFVVESYSDDSGNWYRVYKSGWVEQGGHMNVPAQTTEYNFFKPYASNVKVTLFCGRYTLNFSTAMTNERIYAVAGTPCIKFGINNGSNTTEGMFWRAEGQGA